MSIDQLTQFFGWCSIINIGVMIVTSIAIALLGKPISSFHSRLMGVSESGLPRLYFQYLGSYKIAIFILNLVPYIALKIIA
ncbi:DUF6868 family protein [Immundisolibacter sp.]|jgi:hypothetical protein|uniref:DUF6868 family protein n=1 Tax=Immundisolibacter sp. TaxID=1934948 RepID=UPI000EE6E08C|nr:hypothetical protein [Gammaproteobacteria bacterium]